MSGPVLRVLTYHRVLEPREARRVDRSVVSATPEGFDRQMRHLARHYRPVSAAQALDAVRGRRPLPARAVLVTFDDAYRDVGEVAWPILRRHGVPATVFVPTAFPDRPEREFWWDRLHRAFARATRPALEVDPLGTLSLGTPEARRASLRAVQARVKALPHAEAMALVERLCGELGAVGGSGRGSVLGWDELRSLARQGVALCAHTRTHPALDRLPVEEARAEVAESRAELEREVGEVLPVFAYPYGAHDDAVVEAVREAGFEMALTCLDGHNPLPSPDPLRLCRTNLTLRTSPLLFRLRLTTLFSYVDQWRHRAAAA